MRIGGMLQQQLLQLLSKSAVIEGLNIGDFVQGRVAQVKDGMLLMKLTDGSSLTAKVPEAVIIPEGTLLTLQIGERVGDQLTAKIVTPDPASGQMPENQDLEDKIGAQLKMFGEKATDALVSKVLNLVENNPSLGIDKAAFLVANKMESDQGMQDIIMKLARKEFRIDGNLASLRDQLVTALSRTDSSDLGSLIKPILMEQGLEQAVSRLAEKLVPALENPAAATAGAKPAQEDQTGQTYQSGRLKMLFTKELLAALEKYGIGAETADGGKAANLIKSALANARPAENPDNSTAVFNLPDKILDDAISGFMKDLDGIRKKAEFMQKPDPAIIKRAVERVFEKAFIKAENGVSDPVDVSEKVKALKNAIAFADDALKLVDPKSAQAGLPVMHELRNALQFFNQANTYHTFVQIPLMINNHGTTGELYIMRGKSRRGKIDPDRFTLFISLSTQNLGLVDTFLNATNRCVTINFRVEDGKLSGFIKAHHKVLYEALLKKGYMLAEMRCRLHSDDKINLLNAEQKTEDVLGMNARVDLRL